jgi:hypothetical protein
MLWLHTLRALLLCPLPLVQVLLVALVVCQWLVYQQALQVRVLWGLVVLRLALPLRLQE